MANITVICPNCGAKISVEETKNASTCRRCGTSYFLREAKRVTEIAEEPKKEEKAPKKAAPKKKSAPKAPQKQVKPGVKIEGKKAPQRPKRESDNEK